MKGSLPWQGLPGRNKDEKYLAIKNKKLETSLEELCQNVPREFYDFMESLGVEAKKRHHPERKSGHVLEETAPESFGSRSDDERWASTRNCANELPVHTWA